MSAYETNSYVDIAFIAQHLLTNEQIAMKYFWEIFDIEIPISDKKILAEALKFQLSKSKQIRHLAVFYFNLKGDPFGILQHYKKNLF